LRKVGSLEDVQKAETFRWYLISQDIETKINEIGEHSTEIWVFRDEDWKKARDFFEQFKNAVDISTFQKAAEGVQKTQPVEAKKAEAPLVRSQNLHSTGTFALIAFSVLFFILHFVDKQHWLMRQLMISSDLFANSMGIKSFREIFSGQVWRLFTPIFIHTDFFHILFNMIWLYQFGRLVEESIGTLKFTLLILFIAACSNLAFYLVSGPRFGGMSGVVYGLFAFMWACDRYSIVSPYRLDPNLAKFFGGFYVVCWVLSAVGFPVANTVHGVGAFCGLIAGVLVSGYLKRARKSHFDKIFIYNLLIVLALLAGGIVADIFTK